MVPLPAEAKPAASEVIVRNRSQAQRSPERSQAPMVTKAAGD